MAGRVGAREALNLLLELTRRLTEERTLEEALQEVTNVALRLLPGEHTSVRVLDETRTRLLSAARSGAGEGHKPAEFRPGEGIAGWVVEHGLVARVGDTDADPRFAKRSGQGFRIRSILAVPMWSAGQTIGVLALTSSRPRTFDRGAEELALLLANCAVPPIERARLERLAITDQHTMVYNRRYLLPRLHQEMDAARRYVTTLSLLLLDLDRFKRVNDRHGHAAGDQVLREFVERLGLATRRQDALVRRGGDEFVAILPATPLDAAVRVADRIRRLVAGRRFEPALDVSLRQTVSIGVAEWDGFESAEELEARADAAMYQAKRAGRNRLRRAASEGRARSAARGKVKAR